ncbi:E3 ubiquitin-protein ligase RNF31 isoform X1 [Dermacentor silvarum]|uniref:E3 ubiquitin-protein ligase RNF31 isoform X1 n=2 Tax=Dermacentor silvarum TaxID=543639 RepID=UPI001899421E|nr:E3 ubiquitin-protein ligase RNF31 isoform X1 [Dermacentor silvarum]
MEPSNAQVKRMAGIITENARKLTNDGKVGCIVDGILAVLLMKMGWDEDIALFAAKKEKSIRSALSLLTAAVFVDCSVCSVSFLESDLSQNKLKPCGHAACTNCLKTHFRSESFRGKLTCVECTEEIPQSINFALLKRIFEEDYASFDETLFRHGLEHDEELKYCPNKKCGVCLSVPRDLRKMHCPVCKTLACATCGSEWRKEHENRSCEDFKKWKSENDPNDPEFQSQDLIRKTAIMCPNCKTPYFKARGGCAHFTCGTCKKEFCECCKTEFWKGQACGNEACKNKGMHGHHPRNCFFYTRDYSHEELLQLLKDSNVAVEETVPQDSTAICSVSITNDDYHDSPCAVQVLKAGKCEKHYKEYLCDLIFRNRVDVLKAMTIEKLANELRKHDKEVPEFAPTLGQEEKLEHLREVVAQALPLPA